MLFYCKEGGQYLAQAGSFVQSIERTPWILSKIYNKKRRTDLSKLVAPFISSSVTFMICIQTTIQKPDHH